MEQILAQALGQDAAQLATEEKQRLLSRLLGRLAHEIRNPLSSLDIHVQLLVEDLGELAPEAREKLAGRLEIIGGELKRLDTIVKHFLRLSAPSELNLETIDLSKILNNLCELLRPEAAGRNIKLSMQIPANLPALQGDPVQITQVVMNLLVNALQAVEQNGEVDLEVTSTPELVNVRVSDTGPGIPEGKGLDIFEPYFTTKADGSGLGLWIAQQIALAHHGKIVAANRAPRGAVFNFQIPIKSGTADHGKLES